MKTQIIFTLFLLTASVCSAQEFVAYTATETTETTTQPARQEVTTSSAAIVKLHGEAAKTYIATYLGEHLAYPEQLETIGLNGRLTLRVEVNKHGKVKEVSVKDSELPTPFIDAALEALDGIKKVYFGSDKYAGSRVIYVPIQFSL